MEPRWLAWAKQLQAIAQNGLHYSDSEYERERYGAIGEIAAEMMAWSGETPVSKVKELFASEHGYATPKVDVRGAVFREDRILLVKEMADGCWTLPGGWADPCESPSLAVEREIAEESGFRAKAVKLAALHDRTVQGHHPPMPFHVYKLFFICELQGGEAATSHETGGAEFFAEAPLPPLSHSRVTSSQIALMFQHFRNRDLPTEFD